jgi:hypothetical protein
MMLMDLPGAYAPASIALWVIGAPKPPHHDKAEFLEEAKSRNKFRVVLDCEEAYVLL